MKRLAYHSFAILILHIFILMSSQKANAQLTVQFPSKDQVMISADWYPVNTAYPIVLLCHQNGFSRGEFLETAVRLNKLGFNCMAIDQRIGDEVNNVKNETASNALSKGLKPSFEDAEQDIIAAIEYLHERYNQNIILLGSSYSASLALKIACNNEKVKAVAAFSPGEYFKDKDYVSKSISSLTKPVFITSSKSEADKVTQLVRDVNSRIKVQYIPKTAGDHGSKVLWTSSSDNPEYWVALMSFLNKIKTL
ncbi:MAG: hypothetical protein DWQ44_05845 [Bacteroidetes bacterium]|nr:MAG: hypothetical protein DWQ33_03530 [Bacteroidota bacterium]REK03543.1 MAG: hypothetical protein DWQ39_10130 [Bacteroidota bacterium]REK34846.1 MAG: hypothetical protein DWQ44_05845 [Bacteroidota bacterium]REK51217.1 MAG: hypothetical protein DWQ48_01920 [Bacteroidota bacterium]